MNRHLLIGSIVLTVACIAAACGGSDSPSSPSTGGGGNSGGGSVTTTTVTLTSAGASPKDITVAVGSRVTFVNNDSQPHDMDSNPHPEHTDCPPLNVGFIAAGASGTSQNLTTARTCGYHDHNQPSNTNFQGTIRIQ
jgi:plastocyanin